MSAPDLLKIDPRTLDRTGKIKYLRRVESTKERQWHNPGLDSRVDDARKQLEIFTSPQVPIFRP